MGGEVIIIEEVEEEGKEGDQRLQELINNL